jgi:hypothetical protein
MISSLEEFYRLCPNICEIRWVIGKQVMVIYLFWAAGRNTYAINHGKRLVFPTAITVLLPCVSGCFTG